MTSETVLSDLLCDYPVLEAAQDDIVAAYGQLRRCFDSGGKLLLCGNGGSAADCEHIVGELMKSFRRPRPVPKTFAGHPALCGEGALLQQALPAISLCGHPSLTTAYANDVDPAMVFAQQVYGYGRRGDILLGISTSGNAANICHALRVARAAGLATIGLTGQSGGEMKPLCDICICVPETETYRVQQLHLPVYHALCAMLETAFFGG